MIAKALAAADGVVRPPVGLWPSPGPPVTVWLIGHFVALATFGVVMLSRLDGSLVETMDHLDDPALLGTVALVAWMVLVSMLPAAVARHLIRSAEPTYRASDHWRSVRLNGSPAVLLTLAIVAVLTLPPWPLVGGIITGSVMIGARAVGVAAWRGAVRPPGFYLDCFRTIRAIGPLLVVLAAMLTMIVFVDIVVRSADGSSPWSRTWLLALAAPAAAANTVATCEAISAVARYDRQRHDQLRAQTRRHTRRQVTRDLHDRSMALLSAARLFPADHPGHDRALDALASSLREIVYEHEKTDAGRPLSSWIHHLEKDRAPVLGLTLLPACELRFHQTMLHDDVVGVLDHAADVLLSNSANAGASTARLTVAIEDHQLSMHYDDDGPTFDPASAVARGGGLASVALTLANAGGDLTFSSTADGVQTMISLPLDRLADGEESR